MGRAPCCEKVGLKKGPWTIEEDQKLTAYINEHGHGSWRALPKKAGLLRCGKSCRLRWTNYLRPDIKRGEFSASEEQTIIQLHALLGNRWSAIATHLPKRTDNEIKNYWNTHLKKRLLKMGLDPATHKPQTPNTSPNPLLETPNNSNGSSSVTHMAQWESVRLEAEARLAKEAEMRAKGLWPPTSTRSLTSEQAHNKLDSHELPNSDPLATLQQACGGLMSSSAPCNASKTAEFNNKLTKSLMSLKQETGSCNASNTVEFINTLQNWENSLQGQAGMMWPDAWKLYHHFSTSAENQESSSCSSPSHNATNHSSPTSTLCSSLELLSKHNSSHNFTPSTQARKLYWSANYLFNAHNPLNFSVKPLPFAQLDDGLQGVASKGSSCGEGTLLGIPGLHELMQCDGFSNRSEDSLLIASNSSGFLGDLELVSEDISSSHQSCSGGDASKGDIRQISYSALLGEEYPECEWNSVLKETEDSPIIQDHIESKESPVL